MEAAASLVATYAAITFNVAITFRAVKRSMINGAHSACRAGHSYMHAASNNSNATIHVNSAEYDELLNVASELGGGAAAVGVEVDVAGGGASDAAVVDDADNEDDKEDSFLHTNKRKKKVHRHSM
jgi:hypothetical protein